MPFENRFNSLIAAVVFLSTHLGVVLQAHPSLCSQQGPTCPCLLSSPTATATQQHPTTASRHRPPSVTACEHPTTHILPHPQLNPTPSFHLFSLLCVPHQLPMVFYSQQGPQASNSPLSFLALFFYSVVLFQEKTLNCIEGLLFVLFERNWTTRLFFSTFHIYDYLLRYFCVVFFGVFFVNVKNFYWFMEKWTCSSSAMSLWSRWRSIGFCTHEEINVEELLLLMYWTCGQLTLSRLSV